MIPFFRNLDDFLAFVELDIEALSLNLSPNFPVKIPKAFAERIQKGHPKDPLLLQVLPRIEETRIAENFNIDPVGDLKKSPIQGLLHKYQSRALVVTTGHCDIHCRYCFRQHFPYAEESPNAQRIAEIKGYFEKHPEINELILSGGDPLSLSVKALKKWFDLAESLPSIRRIRIHTRSAITTPERISDELINALKTSPLKHIWVVHINHAQEIDKSVQMALDRLKQAGVTLLNQSVLLKDINDDAHTLAQLSERLFDVGIMPYYLHQLDRVQGAQHFEVGETRAAKIYTELQTLLPGYLVPKWVREIAGEPNKTLMSGGFS